MDFSRRFVMEQIQPGRMPGCIRKGSQTSGFCVAGFSDEAAPCYTDDVSTAL